MSAIDTPKSVRALLYVQKGRPITVSERAEMTILLSNYAALLERINRPVSDASVDAALDMYRKSGWIGQRRPHVAMAAVLEAHMATLHAEVGK